jgi:hypothetical protein
MMSITALIAVFSGRMPGKSMLGSSGRQNRVRDQRFHYQSFPSLENAGTSSRRRELLHAKGSAAASREGSIAMRSERGSDGQVSH